jgi:DNA-binding NtrC family response regulator
LLRVLETRRVQRLGATNEIPVDVRVVCATHRDLAANVAKGTFRQDLYYRISTFSLTVPPLREPPAEISVLADLFAREVAERLRVMRPTLREDALRVLHAHDWPGNVRELRNAIEHAVVMSDGGEIRGEHLPDAVRAPDAAGRAAPTAMRDRLVDMERKSIEEALTLERGNQTRAARRLGMSRRALVYKLTRYGLRRS